MFLNEKYLLNVYFVGTSRRNLELCHRPPQREREKHSFLLRYSEISIKPYWRAMATNRSQIGKAISTCFQINGKIKVQLGFIQS